MRLTLSAKVLPDAGNAFHAGLAPELTFSSRFTRHARCFGGERIEPIHHRVDDFADVQEIAADRSPLATASTTRHFRCGLKQVAYQAVHRVYARGPRAGRIRRMRAMSGSAELSHHFCKLPEFLSNAFAEEDDLGLIHACML